MLPRHGEHVQSGGVCSAAALLGIQLFSGAAQEFGFMAHRREHPRQEQEIARLHRRHVGAKRRGCWRQLNARGRKSGFCAVYHFPLCAPASTCSTSPDTCRASVKLTIASTMSSTSEIIPIGDRLLKKSLGFFACIGVSTIPGATALK